MKHARREHNGVVYIGYPVRLVWTPYGTVRVQFIDRTGHYTNCKEVIL